MKDEGAFGIFAFLNIMLGKIRQELKEGKTLLQFGFLKGFGLGLGMVAPLVIAKYFAAQGKSAESAEGLYGSYSLAKMIVFFFTTLLIASSQIPFVVFANQEKAKTGRINKVFSVQCVFFIVSICIFFAVMLPFNKYVRGFARIDSLDLFFVLLAFLGLAFKTFLCSLFMAMGQRIRSSAAELLFGLLTLSLVLAFYWTGTINLRTVFLVYLISGVLLLPTFIKTIDFNQLRPFALDGWYFKGMFDFTKWHMFGGTAVYFINWGDSLVLRFFTDFSDIGSYNLGYQIFKGIASLMIIISSYFLPFVSQHVQDSQKMRDYLYHKRPRIFLLGLFCVGLLFAAAPYIFRLIYGEAFRGSITVLRILLAASVLIMYASFYYPIINALKEYRFIQTVHVVQVLLNLLLDFLLVPRIGMLGAAIATGLAYLTHVAIIEIYFRAKLRRLLGIVSG